jgi:hypothetical protein
MSKGQANRTTPAFTAIDLDRRSLVVPSPVSG